MAWTANVDQVNRLPDNRVQVIVTYTDPVKGTHKAEFLGNDGVAMLAQIKARITELDGVDTAMRIPLGPVNLTVTPPAPTKDELIRQWDALSRKIQLLVAIGASHVAEDVQLTALANQIKAL